MNEAEIQINDLEHKEERSIQSEEQEEKNFKKSQFKKNLFEKIMKKFP